MKNKLYNTISVSVAALAVVAAVISFTPAQARAQYYQQPTSYYNNGYYNQGSNYNYGYTSGYVCNYGQCSYQQPTYYRPVQTYYYPVYYYVQPTYYQTYPAYNYSYQTYPYYQY